MDAETLKWLLAFMVAAQAWTAVAILDLSKQVSALRTKVTGEIPP